jgi:hypothetical protein
VLSPHISVVPDTTGLRDGQRGIWAAVEISGRLAQVAANSLSTGTTLQIERSQGLFTNHNLGKDRSNTKKAIELTLPGIDRFFEYGCLYNLTVDVTPTARTTICKVLREQSFPTQVSPHLKSVGSVLTTSSTICAGSSILLLVHVRLAEDSDNSPSQGVHSRQNSDELIEELEMQLGDSWMEYMHITVSYSHSAFPEFSLPETETKDGLCNMQSRHNTHATASLKQYNTPSLWSPQPVPSSSSLHRLVERHWGITRANQAIQEMISQRSTPKKTVKACRMISFDRTIGLPRSTRVAASLVPLRQTSHQRERLRNDKQSDQSTLYTNQRTSSVSTAGSDCDSGGMKRYSSDVLDCGSFDSQISQMNVHKDSVAKRNIRRRASSSGEKSRSASAASSLDSQTGELSIARKSLTHRFRDKKESGLWNWGTWF